jgi:phospholipid/cholesterol/gamma-HCH transport system substrate-binding protein
MTGSLQRVLGRARRSTMAIAASGLLLTGCQFGGLNSMDMPGTAGHGGGSYTVTVALPDVAALPQNSPVMVHDVTVGSVSGVEAVQRADGTFYAAVTLSLDKDAVLPANATVKIAQTSLLGSQHEERAGRHPTTEEVLSSLGVVVNKGNLGALQDITDEAYAAVAGRAGEFADVIPRLAELTAAVDRQTADIVAAAESLNRFATTLARNTDRLSRALDALPKALQVLNDDKNSIVDAFTALRRFADVSSRILAQTKDDFAADLKSVYPVVKSLADNANDLVRALQILPTFPFPSTGIKQAVRGDYLNVFTTIDLTVRRMGESLLTTSPFDPNMKHLDQIINTPDFLVGEMANLSGQAADPFAIPPANAAGQEAPR